MRPVVEGLCQYVWLLDETVSLIDIARMNAALDARAENTRRLREAETR